MQLYSSRVHFAHYEPQVPHRVDIPALTLPEFFEVTARDYPTATATIFFGARLTYAQLDEAADRFAAGLQSLGVARGDRVAILLPNCPQFLIALFGVLKAGAVAVPLNPAYVVRELRRIFSDSEVRTVVALDTVAPRVQELMPQIRQEPETQRHKDAEDVQVGARRAVPLPAQVERLVVTQMQDYLSPLIGLMLTVKERRDGLVMQPPEGEGVYRFSDLLKSSPDEYTSPGAAPDDLALLLYTGGTTGTPKGAMLSHRNLVANALQMSAWVWDAVPARKEVFLGVIPFSHSYGMTMVMNLAIAVAGAIVLLPRFTMKDVLRAIARFRPTIFPAVPTMYNAIAHHPMSVHYDLRSVRVCISGAAPLPVEVAQAFEAVTGARLVEGYGLTEASPVTHCNPVHGERRVGSIGLPIPMTDAFILDPDTHSPLPVGEVGELAVRGPQVMLGYWVHPEETAEVLQNGLLFTGDMARMDQDGYFYIVDRKKDLILVGGFSVYPREVEEAMYECDKVQEVVVVGLPDAGMGEIVKAYVVLKQNMEATERELIKFCKERLAPYKVPSKVEFRESLPKSGVGKYLRRELLEEEQKKDGSLSGS